HAPGQDRAAQERAFEPAQTVYASAAEARRLADRVKARNRPVLAGLHATLQVRDNAAEAFAAHDELANGDERHSAFVENCLRFADAYAVAAILPQLGDAPQLRVPRRRTACDLGVIARDRILEHGQIDAAVALQCVHLGDQLGQRACDDEIAAVRGELVDQPAIPQDDITRES